MSKIAPGLIFAAVALIFFGLGLAMVFEAYAVWTAKTSTISQLSADAIQQHPHVALIFGVGFGMVLGALITHFTRWSSL